METEKPKIFFSYARADAEFALTLAKSLRSAGANLWIDQLDIPAGARWDKAVEQALEMAQSVLVILSPKAVDSANVMDEVSFALEQGKRVVPVLSQVCKIPLRLRRIHHIDFTADFNVGLERLLHDLNIKPPPAELQPSAPIPTEPPRPQIKEPRPETEPPEPEIPAQQSDEPAPPKPEPLKTRPYEPEPIKLKPPASKKRPNFLIGAGIAVALAIVAGLVLWFGGGSPRPPETRQIEPPSNAARQAATAGQAGARRAPTVPQKDLTAQEWFEQGLTAVDPDEKIRCYSQAIRLNPDYAEAYLYRGSALLDKGDQDGARRDFDQAIRLKPDYAEAYLKRASNNQMQKVKGLK